MGAKKILIFLLVNLIHSLCSGQINPLDSSGLDSNPLLNQYEIKILDSLFFSPYSTKKLQKIDPKNGFDFKEKKMGFYSCTKNSNTNGNGLLSKKDFFLLCKPNFNGHAGRGIIIFSENEKIKSNGFDGVIIIDCPYNRIKNEDIILKLLEKNE